ncbi:MAG: Ig-like domain-containing protein [SAR324 cluster bacterium]|nr:Ig-like domain-containing protein [SAR324 cluster bacterium]
MAMAVLRLCILGLALLLIGSCGQQKLDSSGLDSKSIEDAGSTTTALAVSSTTPDNGSTSVSRTASIVVNFNKSIYFINSSNAYLNNWGVASTSSVACDSSSGVKDLPVLISKNTYSTCLYANGTIGSSSITIDLKSALDSNTTYKVKVLKESLDGSRKLKDAKDGSGTQLSSDYEFSFTTGS